MGEQIRAIAAYVAALALASIILISEWILTGETAAFFIAHGKDQPHAFALAWAMALMIPILAAMPVSESRKLPKWAFVTCLICAQVAFASMGVTEPIVTASGEITSEEAGVMSAMQNGIADIDRAISDMETQISGYDRDEYRSRREALMRDLAALVSSKTAAIDRLAQYQARAGAGEKTSAKRLFDGAHVWVTVISRIALEIGVICLTSIVVGLLASPWKSKSGGQIAGNISDEKSQCAIAPEQPEIESKFDGKSPKEFLKTRHPAMVCKSISGTKEGPFAVFSDESRKVELGRGKNSSLAYLNAAKNCEAGVTRDIAAA